MELHFCVNIWASHSEERRQGLNYCHTVLVLVAFQKAGSTQLKGSPMLLLSLSSTWVVSPCTHSAQVVFYGSSKTSENAIATLAWYFRGSQVFCGFFSVMLGKTLSLCPLALISKHITRLELRKQGKINSKHHPSFVLNIKDVCLALCWIVLQLNFQDLNGFPSLCQSTHREDLTEITVSKKIVCQYCFLSLS